MQETGLTPFAAVFMGVSMASVTGLMVWCFYRILSQPKPGSGVTDAGPDPAGGPESGSTG